MRKIDKWAEPPAHRAWRSRNQKDQNFGYDLMSAEHRLLVKKALLQEQGNICAYTGRRIEVESSHIEHLFPQQAWRRNRGLDVKYSNLVACWPEPGHKEEPQDGARLKGNWPAPREEHLFVSPLRPGCEKRFFFGFTGKVSINSEDAAASETVKRLGLDRGVLTDLRRIEIAGVLGRDRSLKLKDARLRLKEIESVEQQLRQGAAVRLDPYCFAVKQALQRHIKTLEGIRQSRKKL